MGPRRFAVTATPILPGDPDRERFWKVVTKYNKSYDQYQQRTSRPIPIVRLTPKGG
ncbi:nitroreductase/quinone reductase family protein [Mycobacterium sp. 1274761.0]|uniref:nitroreductase/quinone reductase family protein n=1 Tax=Mycobacterium sp. 1274761.0 TaxID=1834077 RepID=UPI001E59CB42|nr:nitroreductase/quinone reductase family protein [Mycobacterium sp. 1274761.0]